MTTQIINAIKNLKKEGVFDGNTLAIAKELISSKPAEEKTVSLIETRVTEFYNVYSSFKVYNKRHDETYIVTVAYFHGNGKLNQKKDDITLFVTPEGTGIYSIPKDARKGMYDIRVWKLDDYIEPLQVIKEREHFIEAWDEIQYALEINGTDPLAMLYHHMDAPIYGLYIEYENKSLYDVAPDLITMFDILTSF